LLKTLPDYSFIVPAAERLEIDRPLEGMREREGDKPDSGKFQLLSPDVRDLPDGSQRIHLNASHYDDTINESWYVIAHAKSIEPLYHRQHVGIGVGIAAAFGSLIPAAVISPIVGGAVVLLVRRRRRGSATRS